MRIYIHTAPDALPQAFQSLRDLCFSVGLTEGTVRNALQQGNHYRNRQGHTVTRSHLTPCEGRKRPGNAQNWAKNG